MYGDDVELPMREDALPQPVSPYGVSKLAAEQLCYLYFVNFGVPTVSLRYFTVYGPRQRPDMGFHKFLRAAVLGQPISVYGDGEQTRDFTFVDDVVEANLAAATRGVPGRVYNIGGGSRVSVNEVMAMIGRVSGRPRHDHGRFGSKGRHAAYLCRHVPCENRSGVRAAGAARGRPRCRTPLAGQHPVMTLRHTRQLIALAVSSSRSSLAAAVACAARGRGAMPPGTAQPDQFLFDKGNDALKQKKWLTAREFFKQLTETYTQSPLRPDAKLGIGDTYLGEGSTEALVLAINEFQEFLSFYPTNRRADYAQYKLGMAHFRQMRAPQRDQTRDARHDPRVRDVRRPLSEQRAQRRGQGASSAKRATG